LCIFLKFYAVSVFGLAVVVPAKLIKSIDILIVRAYSSFRKMCRKMLFTTCFDGLPSVGRYYNYIRVKEYGGGGLPFIVNAMKFMKFRLLFPMREQKQYNSG